MAAGEAEVIERADERFLDQIRAQDPTIVAGRAASEEGVGEVEHHDLDGRVRLQRPGE